jgi:uncharacterized protein YdeI (YjbR/CyaY-like superfamily)
MPPTVDNYLIEGCLRCKFGRTPQCKVHKWTAELALLREIVLASGLKEEIKWGVPVYTLNGKNVVTVNALKESANLGFYKGVLLTDEQKLLQQQGNVQSDRLIKFTNTDDILRLKDSLTTYIHEAIAIETSGKKVVFQKNPEPVPDELLEAFATDPAFKKAFEALTLGRQRGYIIYFSQPKQSSTRVARINHCRVQIFNGIGLHDK